MRSQLNARSLAGIHASVSIEIRHEDHGSLAEYAATPPAFEVRGAIDKVIIGRPPSPLPRRAVSPACRKDYDAIPGNGPGGWQARFAVDRARFIAAYDDGRRLGALLWDIRVAPATRGCGVGRALLDAAEAAAQEMGCHGLIAETQDINVAACHLYAHAGYIIGRVDPTAYPDNAGETQIVWAKSFGLALASG